jgi:4-amino-4-deoxy-L-arabinose transferase-like glycosyltransferase
MKGVLKGSGNEESPPSHGHTGTGQPPVTLLGSPAVSILLVFLTALVVRFFFLLRLSKDPFFDSPLFDAELYSNWAKSITEGNWLGDGVFFVSPLYAYFLALLYKIFNSQLYWVIFSQFLLGAANCVIIYFIGRKLFGGVVGLMSGLFASLYGVFLFTEGQLLKNSLAYSLVALSFFLFLVASEKQKPSLWFCLGITAGLSVLVIPNVLVFIPVLYATIFFGKSRGKEMRLSAVVFTLGLLIMILPVFLRNYVVGGDPVLISSNGGINLFLGTDPVTEGGMLTSRVIQQAPDLEEQSSMSLAERALQRRLRPSEVSRFWYSMAVNNMTRDISATLQLFIKKLYRFWNWRELTDNLDFYYFREKYPVLGIPLMNFGFMAPLSLLGLWASRREKDKMLPALVFITLFTAASLPFPVFGRYRTPLVPVLMVFAAYGLWAFWMGVSRKRWRELAPGLVIVLLAAAVINAGNRSHNFSPMQRAMGETYLKRGQPEKALPEFTAAVKGDPNDFYSHNALGQAYLETGRYGEAITAFRNAILLYPGFMDAHYSLGLAYAVTGNREGAFEELQKVRELDPTGERGRMMEMLLLSMGGKR